MPVSLEVCDFDEKIFIASKAIIKQSLTLPGLKKDRVKFNPVESVVKNNVVAMLAAEQIISNNCYCNKVIVPLDVDQSIAKYYCDRKESFKAILPFFLKKYGVDFTFHGDNASRSEKISAIVSIAGSAMYKQCAILSCFGSGRTSESRCEVCDKCKRNTLAESDCHFEYDGTDSC